MGDVVRILHVLGGVNLGGAESRIMDIYRKCDREKLQFDFMVHTKEKGYFQDEIESLGGRIYNVPRFKGFNIIEYRSAWKEFFRTHNEYKAVHGHITSTASLYLPIAKKNGINVTIAHARSAGVDKGIKGIVTNILKRKLYKQCDVCIACSSEAAESVFPKSDDVIIIPNGINTREFEYDSNKAQLIKEELGIGNKNENSISQLTELTTSNKTIEEASSKYVIGHVGRFHPAKNHDFLIDIFSEYKKINNNSVLMLIGEGPLMNDIKEKVAKLSLEEDVIFTGNKTPISDYLQAIDYFVFPSIYEGMPGSVIEAQAMGIRCLVSDNVTKEVKVSDLVDFLSIKEEAIRWAEVIDANSQYERKSRTNEIKQAGYDVSSQLEILEEIYKRNYR